MDSEKCGHYANAKCQNDVEKEKKQVFSCSELTFKTFFGSHIYNDVIHMRDVFPLWGSERLFCVA